MSACCRMQAVGIIEWYAAQVFFNKLHSWLIKSSNAKWKFFVWRTKDAWEVSRDQLKVFHHEKLGSGAFCFVFKGRASRAAPYPLRNSSIFQANWRGKLRFAHSNLAWQHNVSKTAKWRSSSCRNTQMTLQRTSLCKRSSSWSALAITHI